VLKEELSQARVATPVTKMKEDASLSRMHDMEQTILNLKLIVEKLHAENKYLRNGRSRQGTTQSAPPTSSSYMSSSDRRKEEVFEKLKVDNERLQKSYNEVLDQNSKLKIDLEVSQAQHHRIGVSCPHCDRKSMDEMATQDIESMRERMQRMEVALDRAKYLVQRANAKERQLKDVIVNLKKRICDLEGIPVISEENSESGKS
jgi:hypothetical protein